MSNSHKKSIPKLKKKLSGFLSDESGKITQEDVLKMSMIAMGIAGMTYVQETSAAHSSSTPHANSFPHSSANYPATINAPSNGHVNSGYGCRVSTTVNGHISVNTIPIANCAGHVNASNTNVTSHSNALSHSSHSSHGQHGSGGWC